MFVVVSPLAISATNGTRSGRWRSLLARESLLVLVPVLHSIHRTLEGTDIQFSCFSHLHGLLVNLTAESLLEAVPPLYPVDWPHFAAEILLVRFRALVVVLCLCFIHRPNHLLQVTHMSPDLCWMRSLARRDLHILMSGIDGSLHIGNILRQTRMNRMISLHLQQSIKSIKRDESAYQQSGVHD